ncbi:MAG TPA: hypothetical protein VI589_09865, partial [Vicinamibacteria bacterium]
MTDEVDVERLREAWQAEVAGPPVVSIEELRGRAVAMGDEFKRTTWVPWVAAAGIASCFGLMFAGLQAPVHRLGALVGIGAALYVVWQAGRLGRLRPLDEGTPSVRVYAWHLAR